MQKASSASTLAAIALSALGLSGCGSGAAAAPTAASRASVGTAASARAPAPAPPQTPAVTCGGFEKLPQTSAARLLGDRLRITPVEGLLSRPRPPEAMSPAPPEEHETRLFLERGDHKLVVFSEEVFARTSPNLVLDVQRHWQGLQQLSAEERTLDSGLRAVLFMAAALDGASEVVPLAHLVTVLPDDTLQMTRVFVSQSVVSAGAAGCQALARQLLGSIEPGERRLDLSGGLRSLSNGYTLQVPPSYALTAQSGPDFTVFQLTPVLPLGHPSGKLGLYFGHHPDFDPDPAAQKLTATILGKPTVWYRTAEQGEIGQEAVVREARGLAVHLFLAAPNAAVADELSRVATSLKRGE